MHNRAWPNANAKKEEEINYVTEISRLKISKLLIFISFFASKFMQVELLWNRKYSSK